MEYLSVLRFHTLFLNVQISLETLDFLSFEKWYICTDCLFYHALCVGEGKEKIKSTEMRKEN